ncbi:hypothetical protein RhiirC2_794033 [Rhizophagus irregularis]|uniref:Uncharacterized protein n=1 Tax=Rhizophagus irregularis TaxID=588596 RepID=A0A2N1ME93_9GLOM|nr:hypothetical protein RhiirC2_794033 [Rhizophagus irregularis]
MYIYKNKDYGILSITASIASALFAIRLINTGVCNENDPAFTLLSESKKRPIFKKVRL